MSRLTITLNDTIHQALKEAALHQRRPIGKIIEESLILRGIKTTEFRSKPTKRRGRVFIYAAKKPGPDEVWEQHGLEKGALPTGSIVAAVDIMTCVELGDGFGYRLAHPERIEPRLPQGHPQPTRFRPFP